MGISTWLSGAGVGLALAAASTACATPAFPVDAAGDWAGTVASKGAVKRIFIHIHKTMSGGFVGTLDSPDLGVSAMAIRPLAAADGALAFEAGGARFRGAWDAALGEWRGMWTEAGAASPLGFRQNVDQSMARRLIRRSDH